MLLPWHGGTHSRAEKCGCSSDGRIFPTPADHALVSAAPVPQLDLWFNGEADWRARLAAAAAQTELIIIEGVTGWFDGAPSAADLAQHLGLPVLPVIDAAAMASTLWAR